MTDDAARISADAAMVAWMALHLPYLHSNGSIIVTYPASLDKRCFLKATSILAFGFSSTKISSVSFKVLLCTNPTLPHSAREEGSSDEQRYGEPVGRLYPQPALNVARKVLPSFEDSE